MIGEPSRASGFSRFREMSARTLHRVLLPLGLAAGLTLGGCALVESAKQRLGILGLAFALDRVDVSHLVYPSDFLSASLSLLLPNRSLLGRIGVDVACDIQAKNRQASRAVFDGGTGQLRVRDTSPSAPSASGVIPAFSVEPNGETKVTVVFPLRLDNPVFAKAAWKAMVRGEDIPYKVDAEMRFKLLGENPLGIADSTRTVTLKVVKGSVNSKAAGGSAVERFLALLDAVM